MQRSTTMAKLHIRPPRLAIKKRSWDISCWRGLITHWADTALNHIGWSVSNIAWLWRNRWCQLLFNISSRKREGHGMFVEDTVVTIFLYSSFIFNMEHVYQNISIASAFILLIHRIPYKSRSSGSISTEYPATLVHLIYMCREALKIEA